MKYLPFLVIVGVSSWLVGANPPSQQQQIQTFIKMCQNTSRQTARECIVKLDETKAKVSDPLLMDQLEKAIIYLIDQSGFHFASDNYMIQLLQKKMIRNLPEDQAYIKGSLKSLFNTWRFGGVNPILFDLFNSVPDANIPALFQNEIMYIKGVNAFNKHDYISANIYFQKVQTSHMLYRKAKFHEAYILYQNDKLKEAATTYQIIMKLPIDNTLDKNVLNYYQWVYYESALNLARIHYDNSNYSQAAMAYGLIPKPHILWIEAMYEQAWAFFLSGDYNRALGNIHSLKAPFFEKSYNPQTRILESIIYFWLCRYDSAKNALGHFITNDLTAGRTIILYLQKSSMIPNKTFYSLAESYHRGSSENFLSLPSSVIGQLVSTRDIQDMMEKISNYEKELNYFSLTDSDFRSSEIGKFIYNINQKQVGELKNTIGERVKERLDALKDQFENSHEQARLLYIELMMGKKNQLMGVTENTTDKFWENAPQTASQALTHQDWASSDKNEYWWDEIGHYVFDTYTLCQSKQGE